MDVQHCLAGFFSGRGSRWKSKKERSAVSGIRLSVADPGEAVTTSGAEKALGVKTAGLGTACVFIGFPYVGRCFYRVSLRGGGWEEMRHLYFVTSDRFPLHRLLDCFLLIIAVLGGFFISCCNRSSALYLLAQGCVCCCCCYGPI